MLGWWRENQRGSPMGAHVPPSGVAGLKQRDFEGQFLSCKGWLGKTHKNLMTKMIVTSWFYGERGVSQKAPGKGPWRYWIYSYSQNCLGEFAGRGRYYDPKIEYTGCVHEHHGRECLSPKYVHSENDTYACGARCVSAMARGCAKHGSCARLTIVFLKAGSGR